MEFPDRDRLRRFFSEKLGPPIESFHQFFSYQIVVGRCETNLMCLHKVTPKGSQVSELLGLHCVETVL